MLEEFTKQKTFLQSALVNKEIRQMAFFKNFHQNLNLPSVSSLVDTLSSAVDDLTSAVGEVGYCVADSVTEQVTSMINGFRTEDENFRTQEDKAVPVKDEAITSLPDSKETNMKENLCATEDKNKQTNYNSLNVAKQDTAQDRSSHYVKDKHQYQLKQGDANKHFSDKEDLEKVGRPVKSKGEKGKEYLVNEKFSKDNSLKSSKLVAEESVIKKPSSGLQVISENSKRHLPKKGKPRSSSVDFKDHREVHGTHVSKHLETKVNEAQKQSFSESNLKKAQKDRVKEVKEKKCKAFSDGKGQPLMKHEENASTTLSKEGKKRNYKESEKNAREVSSMKTTEKGEESFSKLSSWPFLHLLLLTTITSQFTDFTITPLSCQWNLL